MIKRSGRLRPARDHHKDDSACSQAQSAGAGGSPFNAQHLAISGVQVNPGPPGSSSAPGWITQVRHVLVGHRARHDCGGADLAGQAIKAGLVDELQLFLVPVVVGAGKRALPTGVRSDLELLDTQRFASGAVYLRYSPKSA